MPRIGLDRDRVVAVAADMADAEGLEAVTLARVAAELGVKPPSLYNHVEGRDGLVHGIGLLGLNEIAARLRDAAVGRAGTDALVATAEAYRTFVKEHPGRYAAGGISPPSDPEHEAAGAAVLDILRNAMRAWDLSPDEEVHALRAFRASVHGFATLETAGGFGIKVDLDASFTRMITALAEGLQVDHASVGQPLAEVLGERPAVADGGLGLEAHERGRRRRGVAQLGGQRVEVVGGRQLDVGGEALRALGLALVLVEPADVGRGAERAAVLVGDAVLAEQRAQARLRHAGAPRLRPVADVDEPPHAGGLQLGDQLGWQQALVADGEERWHPHEARERQGWERPDPCVS
jgi:AcrR family transcriptional regulator